MKDNALEWLQSAKLDLDSVSCLLQEEHLTPMVAFHCQQALEKSFKAVMELKNLKIPKTHKLQTLIDRLDIDLDICDDTIQILDNLYIESKYPGDLGLLPDGSPSIEDAKGFYEVAMDAYKKIFSLVNTNSL